MKVNFSMENELGPKYLGLRDYVGAFPCSVTEASHAPKLSYWQVGDKFAQAWSIGKELKDEFEKLGQCTTEK